MAIFAVQTVTTIAPLQQAKQALCALRIQGTSWDGWGGSGDDDTGIEWKYLHSGFGIARITAANGTTATAEVISYIPSRVVGEDNASYKWAKYARNSVNGFIPALLFYYQQRLYFAASTAFLRLSGPAVPGL